MGENRVGVTDVTDGAGVASFRARQRTVGGSAVEEQYVVLQDERVVSWEGAASTFRIPGSGAAGQKIATLFNKTGSGVLVAVRELELVMDYITNSGTVRFMGTSVIATSPTTGTVMTPMGFDTAQTQNTSVEFRGGASADGTANAITATPGTIGWRQGHWHAPTAVGQYLSSDLADANMIPVLCDDDPIILREGEGLLVHIIDASSTSASYVLNALWTEFTLP